VLPAALRAWGARRLCFEWDSEPYATQRDAQATQQASALGCEVRAHALCKRKICCADAVTCFAFLQVVCPVSHTLYDPRAVIAANGGKPPLTYTARAQCLLALPWR
jgi:cryptochrome